MTLLVLLVFACHADSLPLSHTPRSHAPPGRKLHQTERIFPERQKRIALGAPSERTNERANEPTHERTANTPAARQR
uniref:Putative secreted protein n=1 Tax=Anopheles triannulatus TaxID=58253 RepID=A0A2M4B4T7_9DIPT